MKTQFWVKRGLILKANKKIKWMQSHVSVPVIEKLDDKVYKMYFCSRDKKNRNQIGTATFNINNPKESLKVNANPILSHGELGTFDDNGVTPTWIMDVKNKKYLYYVGWNQGSTVRMHLYVGLAISADGGKTFKKFSRAPILGRTNIEPFLTATLSILKEKDCYKMWYVSGDGWYKKNSETYPLYNIKYATSKDGINWLRKGIVCIDYKNKNEHALARPFVMKENKLYRMWFSYKGLNYKIGYAESLDGLNWIRNDTKIKYKKSNLICDNVMQEYPFVLDHSDKLYMFYNGNNYGKDGICLATLEK